MYGSNTKRRITDIGIVIKKNNFNVFELSVRKYLLVFHTIICSLSCNAGIGTDWPERQ